MPDTVTLALVAVLQPGPLRPGAPVYLGDGAPWTVERLELRGGLQLPGATSDWQTWALLTRGDNARRWVQVEPPAPTAGDEGDVLNLIRERLELGRGIYGPLQVANDGRGFEYEALEELLDAVVYLAAELLRRRRARA